MQSALLKDPGVIFAGYKQRHPLEPFIEIKVRTKPDYDPKMAFERAIDSAMSEIASLTENLNVWPNSKWTYVRCAQPSFDAFVELFIYSLVGCPSLLQ